MFFQLNKSIDYYHVLVHAAIPIRLAGMQEEINIFWQLQKSSNKIDYATALVLLSHQVESGQECRKFAMQLSHDIKVGSGRFVRHIFQWRINKFGANEAWIRILKLIQCVHIDLHHF